jgi:hypothetical protein
MLLVASTHQALGTRPSGMTKLPFPFHDEETSEPPYSTNDYCCTKWRLQEIRCERTAVLSSIAPTPPRCGSTGDWSRCHQPLELLQSLYCYPRTCLRRSRGWSQSRISMASNRIIVDLKTQLRRSSYRLHLNELQSCFGLPNFSRFDARVRAVGRFRRLQF